MRRLPILLFLLLAGATAPVLAQDATPPRIDSLAVEGNVRVSSAAVLSASGLVSGQVASYRDIQRAIEALFRTGKFDDVTVLQRIVDAKNVVVFRVVERPVLTSWSVSGAEQLTPGDVRGKVKLLEGRR